MEARKAALVEASWCRTLKAARIQSKEAEALLLKSEKAEAEAFEVAAAMGVIMYHIPNCPQKECEIETSSINGGTSTTHTVTASFETAFEVDNEVVAAVKTAFIRLAKCHSFSKHEFKDLLHNISENPDTSDEIEQESDGGQEETLASDEQQPVAAPVSAADKLTMFFQGTEGISDLKVQVLEGLATVELKKQTAVQATWVAAKLLEIIQGLGIKLQTLNLSFEDGEDIVVA